MTLAHCDTCNLFLRPNEGCLHMLPEIPDRGFDGHPFQNVGREHANRLASPGSLSLHARPDTRKGV